jgi:hypothetical protein
MKTQERTKTSGVYKLYDIDKKLIYIGTSSCNLYSRARQSILDKNADYVSVIKTDSDLDASIIEVALIGTYKPKLNKCTASKSRIASTIKIEEPVFEPIINVHNFMDKYSLPSIMETKIFRALSYRITKPNQYNNNAAAMVYESYNGYTVILNKNRVDNIFLDMLNRFSEFRTEKSIVLPFGKICNEIKFDSYAMHYLKIRLENTVDYNTFIPFNEAHEFDLYIINTVPDFNKLKESFEKEGLNVWN